ncbi:putative serine protease PepD [Streptomyces sp. 2333.5]|uniref:trypsin-like peptidase domain-containing protein n=1 Tax=unclassified Streptomyces TaxID=2593676 RepID=UPI0008992C11|nr:MULTISPECIES: trypsin-like peptidase domain-containing protein [unclassified Streptomyces]PJJ04301.1 putative serine protease PepD [Streptomyces sp. 2333.5]SEE46888.1 putative serine protease PepD [Streptomyces sp. 2314.4]SEE73801.1 putative serine protease PepD [Streptomyces sp. 2112.2]
MDDGKAAGPKLKWWSRPGGTARTEPSAEAGPAAGAPAEASGTSEAQGTEDWLMRPPEPRNGMAEREVPEPSEGEVSAERATENAELATVPGGTDADATAQDATGARGDGTAGARPEPSTVTLGKVAEGARDGATAGPRPADPDGTTTTAATAPASAEASPLASVTAGGPAAAPRRQRPLHDEDPYGTPPYGGPGPWAPAPPVQRPVATPAHGTAVPPATGPHDTAPQPNAPHPAPLDPAGPQPLSAAPGDPAAPPAAGHPAAPHGAWQQYDPWSAPLQGGPVAPPPARRRGPVVAAAVALALLAGGIGGGVGAYVERYGGFNDIRLPQAGGDEGGRKPDSVAGIAQAALPGVVTIHVRGSAEQGTGTGFVLDHQGHILTNNHVVEPAATGGEISVTFSGGQTAKARVVGRDGGYDLAVVQVEGVTGLRPLPLGNSDAVRVGDPVVAIGAPFDLANTVTSGIISAKQRPITAGGQKGDGSDVSYVDALQTDAPINPGNSGGPLVDTRARVIGINSAIRAADSGGGLEGGAQGGSIGLGFAIPINQAKRVAEELINTGKATHPVIGVTLEMEYAGDGARVSEHSKDGKQPVAPGGPGAKAGIRAGDVITEVDGAPVHSGQELIVKIRSHRPGDTLALTLQRGGKERSVRLSLGSSSTG